MKAPKYEPLKMGEKIFADSYGKKLMKFEKWKQNNKTT